MNRIFLCSAMLVATCSWAHATSLDLAPPGLSPYTGIDIGDVQIGDEFKALSTFTIDSAGIKFNPFGNLTPQPDTYELDAFIYSVSGGVTGSLLSSAAFCIGPCSNHTLFPANPEDGALNFVDVPINFTFTAGNSYLVAFNVNGGWGSGLTAHNVVEFYPFDPSFPDTPPSKSGSPFTVGPIQVLDGAFGGDPTNKNFAHIRLDQVSDVPEPGSFGLLGLGLLFTCAARGKKVGKLLRVAIARKRSGGTDPA